MFGLFNSVTPGSIKRFSNRKYEVFIEPELPNTVSRKRGISGINFDIIPTLASKDLVRLSNEPSVFQ